MASTIKVDNVQNQPGTNIVSKCGTDVTLGASGDTVALASGASQTGFGRTGTVDWDTASIKTTGFTAVSGNGYFCNTTGGAFTVTLPLSPTAGDIVSVSDYATTFGTDNLTMGRNSQLIEGASSDFVVNVEGTAITFVFVDGTRGWIVTDSGNSTDAYDAPAFMTASVSGACNTLTTVSTDYKLAKFLGPGTFTVSCAGNVAGSNSVDYIIVAGGGGGGVSNNGAGKTGGGGGGAGGLRESSGTKSGCYAVSPLGSGVAAVTVTATGYPISIGGGGPAAPGSLGSARNGTPTTALGLTATGGGGGSGDEGACMAGTGGSGGGEGGGTATGGAGTGNTPPVSPPQGGMGAENNAPLWGGGGGGSGGPYTPCTPYADNAGQDGIANSITASPVSYAGGGGGGIPSGTPPGGDGGGGNGGNSCSAGSNGTVNTGGGGGGAGGGPSNTGASSGGSGIVYIRYKFQ